MRRPGSSNNDRAPDPQPGSGLYDVKGILGDEARLQEFCIQLWCATTGGSREEALQRDAEAREREAKYGPPLEAPDEPWPREMIVCNDCGVTAPPYGSTLCYTTDVPQHRWVRVYTCADCYDAHFKRKWRAIGEASARRRKADGT
jgi:hypothetical protein